MSTTTLYSETRGAFSSTRKFTVKSDDPKTLIVKETDGSEDDKSGQPASIYPAGGKGGDGEKSKRLQNLKLSLKQVFLPHGYPESVSGDYVNYQIWDTVQV